MPPRRGGGGGDGQLRRDLLALLQRGAHGDDGGQRRGFGGGGGGGGRRGGGSAGGAGAQHAIAEGEDSRGSRGARGATGATSTTRPGDWGCRCGFSPNFAHRTRCYSCGKPRAQSNGDGAKGRSLTAEPVGANGLRPQLAWDRARWGPQPTLDLSPTTRVPGASVAARRDLAADAAVAAARAAKPAASGSAATYLQAATVDKGPRPKVLDEDGFEQVPTRKKTAKAAASRDGATQPGDNDAAGMAAGAEAAAAGGHKEAGDGGGKKGDDGGDDIGGGDDDDGEPGPAELRRKWDEEAALVRQLAKQGVPADHPAMEAACRARDAAEQRWRGAKDPAPLGIRLSRAQAKLDRAVEVQGSTRAAMVELEREFRAKYATLQERLDGDSQKVAMRRRQLEEIQEEAGAQAPHGVRPGGGEAIKRVCSTLREMAPAISVLAGQLDAQTPAWQTLNGLLGSLESSHKLLEGAVGHAKEEARAYNIGDGADGNASEWSWSESHDLAGHADAAGGRQAGLGNGFNGQARLQGGGGSSPPAVADPSHDHDMGSGQWWEAGGWMQGQSKWRECGYGQWSRTNWADAWEQGGDGGDGGEAVEPHAKHRRQDDGGEAMQQSGVPGPATPRGADEVRSLADRAALVTRAAIDAGVQPLTADGQELHLLDAGQLDAWVAENLQHLPSW